MLLQKIAKLLNVKSIVTIIMVIVFAVLSLNKTISAQEFIGIFTMVIAFYFGTQTEKKDDGEGK